MLYRDCHVKWEDIPQSKIAERIQYKGGWTFNKFWGANLGMAV